MAVDEDTHRHTTKSSSATPMSQRRRGEEGDVEEVGWAPG